MPSATPLEPLAISIESAAYSDQTEETQQLLEQWGSNDLELLQPALYAAFRQGHVGPAKLLLARGCQCDFAATQAALSGGHIPIFECMVQHGWDVNYSLDHRGDALICALLFAATPDLARWLLENGADPNWNCRSDPVCSTALEAACSRKENPPEIVSLLLRREATGSLAMLVAAWNGNLEALRVLLDEGVGFEIDAIPEAENPDWEREEHWGTALHAAAAKGEMECLTFLLSRGAKTNIRNGAGRTPEQTADHCGHFDCADVLKQCK